MDMRPYVTAINAAYFELFFPNFGNCSKKPKVVPSGQSNVTIGLPLPGGDRGLMAATLINATDALNEHRMLEVHGPGRQCNTDCAIWRIWQHSPDAFRLERSSSPGRFADVASWSVEHELSVAANALWCMVKSGGAYSSASIMEELREPVNRFNNGRREQREQEVRNILDSQHHFGSPALQEHITLLREEFAGI